MRHMEATMVSPQDSVIIRATLRTYGSLWLVMMIVFCFVRIRYPRAYNIRSWAPGLRSKLAENSFGYISWFWEVWWISDDDLREQCGMDALCFTRVYRFGLQVALVGMFNSLWLMPIYGTSPKTAENSHITDPFAILTVGHVPPGSPRFLATVLAAYIQFGATMYLLLREFKWFTKNRHKYLSAARPDNYTVYVSHIPPEFRTSAKLVEYFRSCFSHAAVLEAHIALDIPNLEKKCLARERLVGKLERAVALKELKGDPPMRRNIFASSKIVDTIDEFSEQLTTMNEQINREIDKIERPLQTMSFGSDLVAKGGSLARPPPATSSQSDLATENGCYEIDKVDRDSVPYHVVKNEEKKPVVKKGFPTGAGDAASSKYKAIASLATSGVSVLTTATGLLGSADGNPREAGFVTFSNLKMTQAALQQIHYRTPFQMEVAEAPEPHDIFWKNVGKSHHSLMVGNHASVALTALVCIFWTLPTAFIVTLTELDSLKNTLPFLNAWTEAWPPLDLLIAQLAPLALLAANEVLKAVLRSISNLEGPVSSSVLESSVFVKLALFEIIQTFFISTFSGSIVSEITAIIEDPLSIADLLANSIPGQSSYFMQILFVQTFLKQGLELLRVWPLSMAALRAHIRPYLTDRERRTPRFWLHPLASPYEFEFADVFSSHILYFMVIFVYGPMAPLTNWFSAFCFAILISGSRHQLVFNYPSTPDSGGHLWIGFIGLAQTCMVIAQVTLIGLLALKRAVIAVPCLIPLLVCTLSFNTYVRKRHFLVAAHLPSQEAMEKDLQNLERGRMDMSFVRNQYVQQQLKSKKGVYPENINIEREIESQQDAFMTPPSSETGNVLSNKNCVDDESELCIESEDPVVDSLLIASFRRSLTPSPERQQSYMNLYSMPSTAPTCSDDADEDPARI